MRIVLTRAYVSILALAFSGLALAQGFQKAEVPNRKADLVYNCLMGGPFSDRKIATPISVWIAEGVCAGQVSQEAGRCTVNDERVSWPMNVMVFDIYRKSGRLFIVRGEQRSEGGECKLQ